MSLGKDLVHLLHFARIPLKDIALDALRGFFTGSIIWADKYMLFLVTGGEINVVAIYLSLIPALSPTTTSSWWRQTASTQASSTCGPSSTACPTRCSGGVLEGSAHLQPRYP